MQISLSLRGNQNLMARKGSGWVTLAVANSLVLLTESVDQEFGQGTTGMLCVCPLMSGVTAGRSAEEMTPRWSLTHLECLHLGQTPGASGGAPLCVTWGYSMWPGLVQAWRPQLITFHTRQLRAPGMIFPLEKVDGALFFLTCPWRSSSVTPLYPGQKHLQAHPFSSGGE